MSPAAFCYQLTERARQANKRILLPEGDEPRTIKAAAICQQRGIARCVLLGDPDEIRRVAQARGVELPAGLIGDHDDDEGEEDTVAAARELEEETGYHAERMEVVGEFFSSPGMVSESFTLLRAHGLTKVSDGGGVEGENIVVHHVPLSRIEEAIADWRGLGYAIDVRLLTLLGPRLLGAA